ncbi:MAG: hypothetical protein NVSMB47_11160 [Polyangiales bacterium]
MRSEVIAIPLLLLGGGVAQAAEDDGAYGRLDGDVTLVAGVGGGVDLKSGKPVGHAELRARYLEAAGVYFAYEEREGLGATLGHGDVRRALFAGLELRPLFPARFLKHYEGGRAFANLVLDSLGIDVGPTWAFREGSATRRPGWLLGLGVELPMIGEAQGPWLRVSTSVRWSPERLEGDDDPGGRAVLTTLTLAWHQPVTAHLADGGDRHVE